MNYGGPQTQPRNGLGTAALTLGIIGLVLAFIPIIGFFGFLLGVLALIFGIVGGLRTRKGQATNSGVAWTGLGLGAAAIVVSTAVFGGFAVSLDEELNGGRSAEAGSTQTASPGNGGQKGNESTTLSFGESHTWQGGETVTVSTPTEYTPDNEFLAAPEGKRYASVDVTIRNGGDAEHQVMQTELTAQHNGRVAQQNHMAGDPLPDAQIPPGGETTFTAVYEVGAAPGEFRLSVQPNAFAAETAYFTGEF
ncbi:DUF4190 domain-containing protein [Salinifilum ghardaiensis]